MATESARLGAYADLVGGLLDARTDPATERFDAELTAAVDAGTVPPETARTLRFWQRAALRALADHARRVLPPALSALEASRAESQEMAAADQESWDEATAGIVDLRSPDAAGSAAEAATDSAAGSDEGTESAAGQPRPSSAASTDLSDRRNRLIVAGLMPSASPSDDE